MISLFTMIIDNRIRKPSNTII